MARRRVHGNFKSLLGRLPEAVAEELRTELDETGKRVISRARALVPVKTGKLRSALSYKVLPKSLKMKAGIVGKPVAKKVYYARFVEFGHRKRGPGRLAKLEPVKGFTAAARLQRLRRKRDVRMHGVRARPFLYTISRQELYQPFQKVWGRAVHKAAQGATDA